MVEIPAFRFSWVWHNGSKYAHWLLERGEDETSETLLTLNNQSWVRETNAYNHWPFCGESISFS